MNVLMITVRADPGGGPEHVYQLSQALLAMKESNLSLFIASPQEMPYWEKYKNLLGTYSLIQIPHRKLDIASIFRLMSFIKNNRINLIHSHGKGAGLYSRILSLLTNIPCVHSFHGVHVGEYSATQKSIYLILEQILSSFTTRIIATSNSELELLKSLKICNQNKISLVYNGVPVDRSFLDSPESHHEKSNIVISMVRFTYQKNVELQIEIAEFLRKNFPDANVKFLILGTGDSKAQFLEKILQKNLDDYFLMEDFVEDRRKLLLSSLCYLSTSRWEGLPLSLIEAMAAGVPIIASKVAGNVDLVEHNVTGFLFNPNIPSEAAELINLLLEDNVLRKKMSLKSLENAINIFSSEKMSQNIYKLYVECLS